MTKGIQGWESDMGRGKACAVFMNLVRVSHPHRHTHIDRQMQTYHMQRLPRNQIRAMKRKKPEDLGR